MKETTFSIVLNIRTATGVETFGKFYVGNQPQFANELFNKMKGSPDVNDKTVLSIELRETRNGLPVGVNILSCTLKDIADNSCTITKETFKLFNLESPKQIN